MKVKELNSVMGGGIIMYYRDKFTGEEIDSSRLTGRKRLEFMNRNVYMVFPSQNPKVLLVSIY